MKCLMTAIVMLVWSITSANAEFGTNVDLTRIAREISVEPEYAENSQSYCLAVFGSQARHRVWLVRDGDRLFVDRNGNGNLTDSDETVELAGSFMIGDLTLFEAAGQYSRFQVSPQSDGTYRMRLTVRDRGTQYVGFSKAVRPAFGKTPATAPIVHFDGPMTLGQYGEPQTLPREIDQLSYRLTSLKLMIGTPGLGAGTFVADHCRCRRDRTLKATIDYTMIDGSRMSVPTAYQMHG
ncbi:MAG: hypothetical protein O3B13_05685 [Planctomycetota bacterium]|nr:hypothetical protein [Planctomycetota bacterium]MDA1162570.1 hypothetical protein [Planctomycetota bacterium]